MCPQNLEIKEYHWVPILWSWLSLYLMEKHLLGIVLDQWGHFIFYFTFYNFWLTHSLYYSKISQTVHFSFEKSLMSIRIAWLDRGSSLGLHNIWPCVCHAIRLRGQPLWYWTAYLRTSISYQSRGFWQIMTFEYKLQRNELGEKVEILSLGPRLLGSGPSGSQMLTEILLRVK